MLSSSHLARKRRGNFLHERVAALSRCDACQRLHPRHLQASKWPITKIASPASRRAAPADGVLDDLSVAADLNSASSSQAARLETWTDDDPDRVSDTNVRQLPSLDHRVNRCGAHAKDGGGLLHREQPARRGALTRRQPMFYDSA